MDKKIHELQKTVRKNRTAAIAATAVIAAVVTTGIVMTIVKRGGKAKR